MSVDWKNLDGISLTRRAALRKGAGLGSMLAAIAAAGSGPILSGCTLRSPEHDTQLLVRNLLRLVIPSTSTAGASNQANATFVCNAVEAGLFGVPGDTLIRLDDELEELAGLRFTRLSNDAQGAVLAKLDAATFAAKNPPPSAWLATKALILMSYFTSEEGASKQLRYEPVPGRYDPDLPLDESWKPLANDWSANSIKKAIA